jgi:hypothetical protein
MRDAVEDPADSRAAKDVTHCFGVAAGASSSAGRRCGGVWTGGGVMDAGEGKGHGHTEDKRERKEPK